MAGFHIFKGKDAKWYWHLRAEGNGTIIADSGEGYTQLSDCEHGIDLVKKQAPTAKVTVDEKSNVGNGVPLIKR